METISTLLQNPMTIAVIAIIITIGLLVAPYEIRFEDKEEIEI